MEDSMFKLSESAYQKLEAIVLHEKKYPEEKLYIRLTMGIG
jgi:hypothetical protein